MMDHRGAAWAAVIACAAACGAGPENHAASSEDTTTQPGNVEQTAGDRLSAAYLAGEWCAVEEGRESATTYVFAADGSYRFGHAGRMAEGPGLDAFLQSIDVLSIDADGFVASQMGSRLIMSRGPCPER